MMLQTDASFVAHLKPMLLPQNRQHMSCSAAGDDASGVSMHVLHQAGTIPAACTALS
jgi:hypothetical protein